MTNWFYYRIGVLSGYAAQQAVREQLSKRMEAKAAARIYRALKKIAPIEAQIRTLREEQAAGTVSVSKTGGDPADEIIRKRAAAARHSAEVHRRQTLRKLTEQKDAYLMHLSAAIHKQERQADALYHRFVLGAAQKLHQKAYADPTNFKSEAYAEFMSSLSEAKEG